MSWSVSADQGEREATLSARIGKLNGLFHRAASTLSRATGRSLPAVRGCRSARWRAGSAAAAPWPSQHAPDGGGPCGRVGAGQPALLQGRAPSPQRQQGVARQIFLVCPHPRAPARVPSTRRCSREHHACDRYNPSAQEETMRHSYRPAIPPPPHCSRHSGAPSQ